MKPNASQFGDIFGIYLIPVSKWPFGQLSCEEPVLVLPENIRVPGENRDAALPPPPQTPHPVPSTSDTPWQQLSRGAPEEVLQEPVEDRHSTWHLLPLNVGGGGHCGPFRTTSPTQPLGVRRNWEG